MCKNICCIVLIDTAEPDEGDVGTGGPHILEEIETSPGEPLLAVGGEDVARDEPGNGKLAGEQGVFM